MKTIKDVCDDLEGSYGFASVAQIYSPEQLVLDVNKRLDIVFEFITKIKIFGMGLVMIIHYHIEPTQNARVILHRSRIR